MLNQGFRDFENGLLTKIKNSESPFLGLFEDHINIQTRQKLVAFILKSNDPFQKFIDLMDTYPAVFSTLLVVQLLEDFGEHGHFEVYPVFKKIFGRDLTQNQREKLWRTFRIACLFELGISISPRRSGPHFMVREYLRQVGLPLRYVDQFTKKALRYVNQTGLPDLDDPELLKIWQEGLVTRLTPMTVKEAIQRDDICYHSQMFIRNLLEDRNGSTGTSRIESALIKAIESGPDVRKTKRAGIPRIIFREFEYGVLLPGSQESVQWEIKVETNGRTYTSRNDDRFIAFDAALPLDVLITNDEGFSCSYPLWQDQKDNRLLIFSMPEGKFMVSASLAEKEVFFDPGKYLVLARFVPEGESELEMFSESPEIYAYNISLAPGETYAIQRGPAKIQIKAEEKPVLYFNQDPLRGVRGNELYRAGGLKLEIIIPKEMMSVDKKFVIKMTSKSLGDEIELPFPIQEENQFVLNIGKVMEKFWDPGVSRVLFEVFREDIKRSLVRKSAVLWNGLDRMKNRARFFCIHLPKNLMEDSCENLESDRETKSITFKDETNRFFKMAFEDGPRLLFFTWSVPGIFLSLRDYAREGQNDKGLKIGETISINTSSRKVLTIFSSEPALLKIGTYEAQIDFTRLGSKKIPLSGMVEYLEPGHDALLYISEKYTSPIRLLHFVSPFEAKSYSVTSGLGQRKIEVTIRPALQALRLSMKNLTDGNTFNTDIPLEQIGQTDRFEILPDIHATFFKVSPNECTVHFPDNGWPSGLWLTSFMIKAENRWGALTDSKGAVFADGLVSSPNQVGKNFDELWWWFSNDNEKETYTKIFGRLDEALQTSYALDCWSRLSWLESFWIKLGRELSKNPRTGDCLELLSLTGNRNSITDDGYAIPAFHPGTAVTDMFCLEKSLYPDKRLSHSCFHSCLRFVSKINDPCRAFSHGYFDFAALFGFANALEVAQTECCPQCFELNAYIDSLKARDLPDKWRLLNDDQWIPAKGDMLGPMHYRYAFSKFKEEFLNAMATASERLGSALFLARQMKNVSIKALVNGKKITRAETDIDSRLFFDSLHPRSEFLDDEAVVALENQEDIIRFISLFAQACRWESREKGAMENFKKRADELCKSQQSSMNKYLGYLLYLSEDLFGFYLLLWELVFSVDCDMPRRRYV